MFKRDEWNTLADLLANLIEKYAAELDIDNLPDPDFIVANNKKSEKDIIIDEKGIAI